MDQTEDAAQPLAPTMKRRRPRKNPTVVGVGTVVLVGSAAVLAVAGVLWVLKPSWRPGVATFVVASPVPPVP